MRYEVVYNLDAVHEWQSWKLVKIENCSVMTLQFFASYADAENRKKELENANRG